MNRVFAISMVLALCLAALAGCASAGAAGAGSQGAAPADDHIRVVCTTFPSYDWTVQLAEGRSDRLDITLLGGSADLHSFQPSVADIAKIADADLLVYVGGESDAWVDDALATAPTGGPAALSLLAAAGDAAVEEELVEGMQPEEENADAGEDEGPEYDEHVWLSLRCAQTLLDALAAALSQADPDGAATYQANANAYNAQLQDLDARYAQAAGAAPLRTLVVADRFPFRYLANDYGLAYYAAFAGCSAETEASFQTVAFLAQKVDELDVPAVLCIDGSDQAIARTVVAESGRQETPILVMDSMQADGAGRVAAGDTYLGAMERNLGVLTQALVRG